MSRNIDIYSLESRVNALESDVEPKSIRSYDLYSLEKRVYNLEQGGSPTPPTPQGAVLLWEGDGRNIGSFTVDLDLTNYGAVIVEATNRDTQISQNYGYCIKGTSNYIGGYNSGNNNATSRSYSVDDNGVHFDTGRQNTVQFAGVCIPTKIYGLPTNILP